MKLDTNAVKEILKDFPPINGYLPLPRARGDNSKNSIKKLPRPKILRQNHWANSTKVEKKQPWFN